jgi:hypothetical protein
MTKPRIIETEGVFGELNITEYDRLQRGLRDKGQLSTEGSSNLESVPALPWRLARDRVIWVLNG